MSKRKAPVKRTTAEWASLVLSVVIVAALVGVVSYSSVAYGEREPDIEVTLMTDEVRESGGVFYLPLEVRNRGDVTAEQVRIIVMTVGDGSEIVIDYLAGGATAKAVAVFRSDPRTAPVRAEVKSYIAP